MTLPTTFDGVSVSINGVPAPLYYVSAGQVNIQIPYDVAGQQQANVSVSYNGTASRAQSIRIAPTAPSLYLGVFNSNGSLNSADNPASSGNIVTLFATGHGITSPVLPASFR